MFKYRKSICEPERYNYDYTKDNIRLECELRLFKYNVLRVYFSLYKVYDENRPEDVSITDSEINEYMLIVDDFMNMLNEHLVIDEPYDKIIVCPYGDTAINKIVKRKYNLEYSYEYE